MTIFTPPQVATRWKCKPETVRRLLERGALRGFTLAPPGTRRPRWRVTLDAILEYEEGTPKSKPARIQPPQRARRSMSPTGPF